ncbi:FtsX-like permease family protein [Phytomonospora sp. NPDC050363]|uniref:ABC transporter permease n=1 Tax=Phytomonospora sp. NPDC050363 TaxID=3155642 RepID=UPI0033EC6A6D
MSVAARGIKNTFRNKTRGGAVILVLAIVVGLTLSMLVANEAVASRLATVRAELDTTITAMPAFSQNAEEMGYLSAEQLERVRALDHVAGAEGIAQGMLELPKSEEDQAGGPKVMLGAPNGAKGTTNLESAVDGSKMGAPEGMKFPITVTGTDGNLTSRGVPLSVVDGRALEAADERGAIVSDQVAEKNGLAVGDTFTAFEETFTVVGIATTGEYDDVGVVMTAATLMDLGELDGYNNIVVEVDDVAALPAVGDALGELLGDTVEIRTESQSALEATQGLESVDRITWLGFLICLLCAAVIVFFTLALTVRERRKEVGVLKAIGATSRGVVAQFGIEAVTLVLAATVLGLGVTMLTSNLIADVLVTTNTPAAEDTTGAMTGGGPGKVTRVMGPGGEEPQSAADLIGEVTAGLGWNTLALGVASALGIALLGSVVPAWLIARVRPAEVLRGE